MPLPPGTDLAKLVNEYNRLLLERRYLDALRLLAKAPQLLDYADNVKDKQRYLQALIVYALARSGNIEEVEALAHQLGVELTPELMASAALIALRRGVHPELLKALPDNLRLAVIATYAREGGHPKLISQALGLRPPEAQALLEIVQTVKLSPEEVEKLAVTPEALKAIGLEREAEQIQSLLRQSETARRLNKLLEELRQKPTLEKAREARRLVSELMRYPWEPEIEAELTELYKKLRLLEDALAKAQTPEGRAAAAAYLVARAAEEGLTPEDAQKLLEVVEKLAPGSAYAKVLRAYLDYSKLAKRIEEVTSQQLERLSQGYRVDVRELGFLKREIRQYLSEYDRVLDQEIKQALNEALASIEDLERLSKPVSKLYRLLRTQPEIHSADDLYEYMQELNQALRALEETEQRLETNWAREIAKNVESQARRTVEHLNNVYRAMNLLEQAYRHTREFARLVEEYNPPYKTLAYKPYASSIYYHMAHALSALKRFRELVPWLPPEIQPEMLHTYHELLGYWRKAKQLLGKNDGRWLKLFEIVENQTGVSLGKVEFNPVELLEHVVRTVVQALSEMAAIEHLRKGLPSRIREFLLGALAGLVDLIPRPSMINWFKDVIRLAKEGKWSTIISAMVPHSAYQAGYLVAQLLAGEAAAATAQKLLPRTPRLARALAALSQGDILEAGLVWVPKIKTRVIAHLEKHPGAVLKLPEALAELERKLRRYLEAAGHRYAETLARALAQKIAHYASTMPLEEAVRRAATETTALEYKLTLEKLAKTPEIAQEIHRLVALQKSLRGQDLVLRLGEYVRQLTRVKELIDQLGLTEPTIVANLYKLKPEALEKLQKAIIVAEELPEEAVALARDVEQVAGSALAREIRRALRRYYAVKVLEQFFTKLGLPWPKNLKAARILTKELNRVAAKLVQKQTLDAARAFERVVEHVSRILGPEQAAQLVEVYRTRFYNVYLPDVTNTVVQILRSHGAGSVERYLRTIAADGRVTLREVMALTDALGRYQPELASVLDLQAILETLKQLKKALDAELKDAPSFLRTEMRKTSLSLSAAIERFQDVLRHKTVARKEILAGLKTQLRELARALETAGEKERATRVRALTTELFQKLEKGEETGPVLKQLYKELSEVGKVTPVKGVLSTVLDAVRGLLAKARQAKLPELEKTLANMADQLQMILERLPTMPKESYGTVKVMAGYAKLSKWVHVPPDVQGRLLRILSTRAKTWEVDVAGVHLSVRREVVATGNTLRVRYEITAPGGRRMVFEFAARGTKTAGGKVRVDYVATSWYDPQLAREAARNPVLAKFLERLRRRPETVLEEIDPDYAVLSRVALVSGPRIGEALARVAAGVAGTLLAGVRQYVELEEYKAQIQRIRTPEDLRRLIERFGRSRSIDRFTEGFKLPGIPWTFVLESLSKRIIGWAKVKLPSVTLELPVVEINGTKAIWVPSESELEKLKLPGAGTEGITQPVEETQQPGTLEHEEEKAKTSEIIKVDITAALRTLSQARTQPLPGEAAAPGGEAGAGAAGAAAPGGLVMAVSFGGRASGSRAMAEVLRV